MAEKTAVVTGAEGFIGSCLVRELLDAGWSVVALHRPDADLWLHGLSVERRPCDITRTDDLARTIPKGAQALFHLAADRRISRRRLSRQREVNVEGTRNVLNAAIESGVGRLLYTSSMAAFGLHRQRIDETTASNALETPVGYFRTKHLGEIETDRAIDRGLDAVIVNPAHVMGPRNTQNMTASFIRVVHAGTMPVIGPGAASFCHVHEVARAMIACIERGRTGERHLLGGADATFLESPARWCGKSADACLDRFPAGCSGRWPPPCRPRRGSAVATRS
jgi:dihydroflavonol-4-reductase